MISTVKLVYDLLPAGNPLRRLVLHVYVYLSSKEWMLENTDEMPKTFLADYVKEVAKTVLEQPKTAIGNASHRATLGERKCFFHIHNDDCPGCEG